LIQQNTPDTISQNSLPDSLTKKRRFSIREFFKDGYPSPKKAALLSLIIPGGGQAYNKKYWKIPIVYAAYGGLIYSISFNTKEYRRFKIAYRSRVDDDPCTIDEFVGGAVDADGIKRQRDLYRKRVELSYVGLVLTHLLGTAEAFTNAYLLSFNVDDDLTILLKPSFEDTPFRSALGLGLGVQLQSKKEKSKVFKIEF